MSQFIDLRPGENVRLVVHKADNWIGVVVNGALKHQFAHASDQVANTGPIELTPLLGGGVNTICVIGVDWGGTAELRWTMEFSHHGQVNGGAGPHGSKRPLPHFGESVAETYILMKP